MFQGWIKVLSTTISGLTNMIKKYCFEKCLCFLLYDSHTGNRSIIYNKSWWCWAPTHLISWFFFDLVIGLPLIFYFVCHLLGNSYREGRTCFRSSVIYDKPSTNFIWWYCGCCKFVICSLFFLVFLTNLKTSLSFCIKSNSWPAGC